MRLDRGRSKGVNRPYQSLHPETFRLCRAALWPPRTYPRPFPFLPPAVLECASRGNCRGHGPKGLGSYSVLNFKTLVGASPELLGARPMGSLKIGRLTIPSDDQPSRAWSSLPKLECWNLGRGEQLCCSTDCFIENRVPNHSIGRPALAGLVIPT